VKHLAWFLGTGLLAMSIAGCSDPIRTPNESTRVLSRQVALRSTEVEIYFASGSAVILPGGFADLKEMSARVNYTEEFLLLQCHASIIGKYDQNLALSLLRGHAVAEALESFGVPPEKIIVRGFGETRQRRPEPNATEDQMVHVRVLSRQQAANPLYVSYKLFP